MQTSLAIDCISNKGGSIPPSTFSLSKFPLLMNQKGCAGNRGRIIKIPRFALPTDLFSPLKILR